MRTRRVIVPAVAIAVLSAFAMAQSTRRFVDAKAGIELRIPRWLEPVPMKPGDLQTLLQLKGSVEVKESPFREPLELTLLVFRISKEDAPVTGEEPKDGGEGPGLKSVTELRKEALNAGKTVPEFLQARGFRSDLVAKPDHFRKPVADENGHEYVVSEYATGDGEYRRVGIRAFASDDGRELFGLVAIGAATQWVGDAIDDMVRSLKRAAADADATGDDPYAGATLRDVERRRKVRGELVAGWEAFDTENFILVTNVTKKKIIEDVLADLETMRAAFLVRFPPAEGADMSAVSTVRLCDGYDDYLRYAGERMDGTGGYWAFQDEELVLFNPERKVPKLRPWLKDIDALAILYHEAMHQYFHYSNRQLAPGSWFNEGYGEVFGGADVDRKKGEIRKFNTNSFRMKLIRAERKRLGAPSISMMLLMSQSDFYGPGVLVNYANAWSFCYFLEMERQKPERERVQAWADFPDVYLRNLREATEEYRKRLPDNAPDDWITGFQDEIQKDAIRKTLKTVDEREMGEAWQKAVMKWR